MSGLSLGTRVSNFKSVALTVLELLAFNSHDRPLRARAHTHTLTNKYKSNERITSAIHFVHLAEIINDGEFKKSNGTKKNRSINKLKTPLNDVMNGHSTSNYILQLVS